MEDCAEKRLKRGPAGGHQREAGPVLLAAGVGEGRAEAGVRQPRAVAGGGLAPPGALRHPPLAARAALAVAWEGEVVWKLWDGSRRVIGRLKLFEILDKRYWFPEYLHFRTVQNTARESRFLLTCCIVGR